jgi:hypothetical protein
MAMKLSPWAKEKVRSTRRPRNSLVKEARLLEGSLSLLMAKGMPARLGAPLVNSDPSA